MDYYCDVCDIFIKPESKYQQFKSKTHKGLDKCKHITLTNQNPYINDMDEIFYAYIVEHNKRFDIFVKKSEFKLVFNDNQFCPYVTFGIFSDKTMCSWYKFLENLNMDFENKGYNFNHTTETNFITIAIKMDRSYDFCIKHILCALE